MNPLEEKKLKERYGINHELCLTIENIADGVELDFKNGVLDHTELSDTEHKSSHIQSCALTSVNLMSAGMSESKFDRVFIETSRLSGIDLGTSIVIDAVFKKCKVNGVSFRSAELKRVLFYECDLTDADFQSADLEKVVFRSCELAQSDFSHSRFKEVDIRGSRINGARFGLEQLKDLTIDQGQATYIALLTGVKID